MIKMTKTLFILGMVPALGLLGGCSGNDDILFEHGIAGPNTEATLKQLPEGLLPDQQNARHSSDSLKPEG